MRKLSEEMAGQRDTVPADERHQRATAVQSSMRKLPNLLLCLRALQESNVRFLIYYFISVSEIKFIAMGEMKLLMVSDLYYLS